MKLLQEIPHIFASSVMYVKSSILSIVVLSIMFFLLTKMEQATSMVVHLMETDIFSLLFAFYLINILAFSLSHYPIYTYYAANLNKSKNVFEWDQKKAFGLMPVTVFRAKFTETYHFDVWANIFRYLNGLLVFTIWSFVLIYGFEQNLQMSGAWTTELYGLTTLLSLLSLTGYGLLRKKKFQLKESITAQHLGKENYIKDAEKINDQLNYQLSVLFFFISLLFMICLGWLMYLVPNEKGFSGLGLALVLTANFCLMILYFNFRLIRPELRKIERYLSHNKKSKILSNYIRIFKFTQQSEHYLSVLIFTFFVSLLFLVISHFRTISGGNLANGIPVLFAYLYVYSFIIFSIFKYFFVTRKQLAPNYRKGAFKTKRFYWMRWIIGSLCFTFIFLLFLGGRTRTVTHLLTEVPASGDVLSQEDFVEDVSKKKETVFFIAAQGGGLRGNFWTLHTINKLQAMTEGELLKNTIAMSGASGGSLGLGLYTALYGKFGDETALIQEKIAQISRGNYTSMDLSLMFGWDFIRKLYPLNKLAGSKDRAYYKMLKYQNIIEGTEEKELSMKGFRSLWMDAYEKAGGNYPSLIINTASNKGSRGIFWSHEAGDAFTQIFPNAQNLLDLGDHQTLPFYQAISTTNRFPLLSPAARINGKGHFIDAGAIDNGGLMGCFDLYHYLLSHESQPLAGKRVVFIEIMNSQSSYANHLIDTFDHGLTISEMETSTFEADLSTGLNLDKIPDYMSRMIYNMAQRDSSLDYIPVFLPHRISTGTIEKQLGGALTAQDHQYVSNILAQQSAVIQHLLQEKPGFCEPWQYTEPALSRHFSDANIAYGVQMLDHPNVKSKFEKILHYCRE